MLTTQSRAILEAFSVDIQPGVQFGWPDPGEALIEPPVQIRPGVYDVEFIGAFSFMGGRQTELRHVGMIGRFCSIAYNIMAGVEEHPTDFLSPSPFFQGAFDWKQAERYRDENRDILSHSAHIWWHRRDNDFPRISIGSDVWIGEGALIRRGVSIGDGAVIASRAIVTKDVPAYAIVAGAPARILRYRFEPAVIADLLALGWWNYGLSALDGVDLSNIHQAIHRIDVNIASGRAEIYETPLVRIDPTGAASALVYDHESQGLVPMDMDGFGGG